MIGSPTHAAFEVLRFVAGMATAYLIIMACIFITIILDRRIKQMEEKK